MPTNNTAPPNVVVIGGSQGAVKGLLKLVPKLPANLPSAIGIVVHISPDADGAFPAILRRHSKLPVDHATNGEALRPGRIYVAPPDHHFTLEGQSVRVRKGPRENRHRPAIDPLFRSAARSSGPAVIAVLLSGYLDDGAAGLFAVRTRGGIAIVQDPDDAQVREMPQRALDYAGADYVLPLNQIASKVVELADSGKLVMKPGRRGASARDEVRSNEEVSYIDESNGKPSVFACPECHGVLWAVKDGKLVRYRCRVGHGYTESSLRGELDYASERALWAATRALEEKAAMTRRMIDRKQGPKNLIERLKDQAQAHTENAHLIRKMIFTEK